MILLLVLLAVIGCQAQSSDPVASLDPQGALTPTAEIVTTATARPDDPVTPVDPQGASTPTAEIVATATARPDDPITSVDDATEESEMSAEATLAETETASGSDGLANDDLANDGLANANVDFVRAVQGSDSSWTFHVTVRHPDTGWEDYADGWDVMTPDGQVLKSDPAHAFTRLLLHPHENEQPFTRSQSGIVVPDGVTMVTVRAHDLVDGFGGRQVTVDLTIERGPDFEVEKR